ncbi:MAG: hypothetical protein HQL52_07525 [Magnetococcales bacterium]|nr:hypothetical protein [Magnetococcales bacterium]
MADMDRVKEHEEIVTNGEKIETLLRYCLEEGVRVEVELGERVRLYHTTMTDHLPELVEESDEEGNTTYKEAVPYEPFSYLASRDRLVLDSLTPETGNQELMDSADPELMIRFFQGNNAVEGEVSFQKAIQIRGDKALLLSYPTKLRLVEKRRYFRVLVRHFLNVTLTVKGQGIKAFKPSVYDVGAGGLAFCHEINDKDFPLGMTLQLTLGIPGEDEVQVDAFVRRHYPVNPKIAAQRQCRLKDTVCCVQFDLQNRRIESIIGQSVTRLQQKYLSQKARDMGPMDMGHNLKFRSNRDDPSKSKYKAEGKSGKKAAKKGAWLNNLLGSKKPAAKKATATTKPASGKAPAAATKKAAKKPASGKSGLGIKGLLDRKRK